MRRWLAQLGELGLEHQAQGGRLLSDEHIPLETSILIIDEELALREKHPDPHLEHAHACRLIPRVVERLPRRHRVHQLAAFLADGERERVAVVA